MYMEETDALLHDDVLGHAEMGALAEALLQMDTILAYDVIQHKHEWYAIGVVIERVGQGIIHVALPFAQLEVDHGMWNEAPVPGTCSCANTSYGQVLMASI